MHSQKRPRLYIGDSLYTYFSSAHSTFSRMDNMVGHRSLSKFKTVDIISSTFPDDNTMRLDINYKERLQNTHTHTHTNMWRLNNATKQPMDH